MIAPLICNHDALCWIEGLGFRPVIDTGAACAIDDEPFTAKYDTPAPALDIYAGTYGLGSSLVTAAAMVPRETSCCLTPIIHGESSTPPVSPVPLPASAGFMLAAMALVAAPRLWRAACRFGDWFVAERGTGPGKCGWV